MGAVPGRAAPPRDPRAQGPSHFSKGLSLLVKLLAKVPFFSKLACLRSGQGIVLVSVECLYSFPLGVGPASLTLANWMAEAAPVSGASNLDSAYLRPG